MALSPSDKERLATLEADIPWIKDSLERTEGLLTDLHSLVGDHLIHHRNGSSSDGQNGGVALVIGGKTMAALLTALVAAVGLAGAYLKKQGLI